MAQAKNGDTVKVHYTGKLEDGTVFDTSADRDPLEFKIGEGSLIPSFEQAIVGMTPGESKTIQLTSDEAYGQHREEMVVVVNRSELPPDLNPEVGQQLQINQPNGQALVVAITDVSELNVTLDGNHPLAGKDLAFDIELVKVG
ncbi:MAG: peptidylprolyl isomerase [Desulfobacterales bacterium]|nr:peptidylprolyl isomerase [Desulfobacterales bacterium]